MVLGMVDHCFRPIAGIAAYIIFLAEYPHLSNTSTRYYVEVTRLPCRSVDYAGIVSSQTMTRTYAEMLMKGPVLQGVMNQF